MNIALKLDVTSRAVFSQDERYRYRLDRLWSHDPKLGSVTWIMLNPSTATAEVDDPTVAKCQTYTRRWGYRRLTVVNLFAWRDTSPFGMKRAVDPVGPENDYHIRAACHMADLVMAAWGNDGAHRNRSQEVRKLLALEEVALYCLKINQGGEPAHPLYQRLSAQPILYA